MTNEMRRLRRLTCKNVDYPTSLVYGSGFGRWARAEVKEGFSVKAFESCIEYISADIGPKRGLKQESTIVFVCNHLLAQGFELVSVYAKRQVLLFNNQRIKAKSDSCPELSSLRSKCRYNSGMA